MKVEICKPKGNEPWVVRVYFHDEVYEKECETEQEAIALFVELTVDDDD